MGQFVKIGTVAEFEDVEAGKLVDAGGRSLAVFKLGTTYCAIDNTCTHRGGPLAEGTLVGEEVICPCAAAIQELADRLEQAGFPEDAYPAPDWEHIGSEEGLVAQDYGKPRRIVNGRN